ncbi:hypothetical protein Pcinc_027807 [Petrolisthes cinctipes]|uniref:ATPase V1 complex subunit H C-terminal domain-containing protein n=1 Tax=Petrolisthes cinctipes TaxID=88211 RepID=A0AAE1F4E4_PETCI|nr:hypothetical protein Pcinc_027807 [Petrolisthes cinctipes]
MTYDTTIAEQMNRYSVIPSLADILSESVKEKVTRIVLAVFRNLIVKPQDPQIARENCIQMVQCKVMEQLVKLTQKDYQHDEDIYNNIKYLTVKLQNTVQYLCSFEYYSSEVKSGRMEWSPVHKSEKFWRENADRLNDDNYELLKILVRLLHSSKDNLVLSVACHDLGQYVSHYILGRRVLETLKVKEELLLLLSHPNSNVKHQALHTI